MLNFILSVVVQDFDYENDGKKTYIRKKSKLIGKKCISKYRIEIFCKGKSKEGRPLKAVVSYDITDLRIYEIELEKKQKILEDTLEKQEYLVQFFDNCPTMMGITEMDENGKLMVKLANASTEKFYIKGHGDSIFSGNYFDEDLRIFRSKFSESRTTGNPVYFETSQPQNCTYV